MRWMAMFKPQLCVLLLGLAGCASPVVGLTCAEGFEECGRECVDLASDSDHCGSCGNGCSGAGSVCVEGQCQSRPVDAGVDGDAEQPVDAGDAGDAADAGGNVRPLPPQKGHCDGTTEPEDCTCDIGEIKCGNECFDGNSDLDHCGSCDNQCAEDEFCALGICTPDCVPPLTQCGTRCLPLEDDFRHCGGCAERCSGGVCKAGTCLGETPGHVVVVGHSFLATNPEQSKIPPGAVTLNNNFSPRILGYSEHSDPTSVERINATLEEALGIDPASITQGFLQALSLQLVYHDVLLIYPQRQISQADLESKVIPPMDAVLVPFLARGGVILLFEDTGRNLGTYQILADAGVVTINRAIRLPEGQIDKTQAGFRDFTNGVSAPYVVQNGSYGFSGLPSTDSSVLLYSVEGDGVEGDLPVVIHNIFVRGP